MFTSSLRYALTRVGGAVALAVVAALSLSQGVLADNVSGVHGHYRITDSPSSPGATCKYVKDQSSPKEFWLSQITAVAPSLWWPDQGASSATHGQVGWRFLAQNYGASGTPSYTTVAVSAIQKAIAYKDSQHPYGRTTKAHLTPQTVGANGKILGTTFRVVINALWYKSDGSVSGKVSHVGKYYLEKLPNGSSYIGTNNCPGLIVIP